jgi:hypothetical protein
MILFTVVMKKMIRSIVFVAATLCALTGVHADEQVASDICPKPYLDIDFEDQSHMQILERDFISYEACITDYAIAIVEKVRARKQALDTEVAEESWSEENEDEQTKAIEDALEDVEAYSEALARSRQDFERVVQAILGEIPADVFNQWGAETKVAQP